MPSRAKPRRRSAKSEAAPPLRLFSDGTPRKPAFPIVGVGASAGGLEALELLFSKMPVDTGLAFVVIQHLSPDYKSLMVELLSKRTAMPVYRAEEGMQVEPNAIYLIPPKKNLTIFHGSLVLSDQDPKRGVNLPIDIFFRSLADDQGENAIGVILSGTGSDGMRGVKAIKEVGGLVIVEDMESAKFDGMPRAAISTGLADFVLPPEEIPAQLVAYTRHPYIAKIERTEPLVTDEDSLRRIFFLLRERTKVDFTLYKPSTILRRIERRISINKVEGLRDYVRVLENTPREINTLFRELLIGVTSFFRDREVFDLLLEKHLAPLFERSEGREVRIWVPGCSTGEEAYGIAITCLEVMERTGKPVDVKIFATDIDHDAVVFAGNGVYPESVAADIPPRLAAKYFVPHDDRLHVLRRVREMVVFARHNLVKDPPFTNLDLVSCRNLLIYLQPVLQRKALEYFNFALRPGGLLVLGTSETVGEMADAFELVDHKWKLYRAKGGRRTAAFKPELTMPEGDAARAARPRFAHAPAYSSYQEERVLDRFLQALSGDYLHVAMVVNEDMEILHIVGDGDPYLRLPAGKVTNDVTKMTQKELAIPLATGLGKAFKEKREVRFTNIHLPGTAAPLNMRIKRLPEKKGQEPLAAVFIDEESAVPVRRKPGKRTATYDIGKEVEQRINDLEQDLQFTKENLQATIEELETSNEELQATNEELLASNEELQSTNEELQSVNEELFTVNNEYQAKITELTMLNHDMDNLLASIEIATVFLDENLEIRKFTPQADKIFKILAADVGRPLGHLPHFLRDADPAAIAAAVAETNRPVVRDVETADGHWYLLRALPYNVGPQQYSGVVLTFVEISKLKEALRERDASRSSFRRLFETMTQGVVYQVPGGRIVAANAAAERILGLTQAQLLGRDSLHPEWRAVREDGSPFPGDEHPAMVALRTGREVLNEVMGVYHPTERLYRWINVNAVPQFETGAEQPYEVIVTFEDITSLHRYTAGEDPPSE